MATATEHPAPADWQALRERGGVGPLAWSVDVERVDRERILRGWTQRQLARNAHVDPGTLSDLLARRRRPTLGTMQSICTALNLTLAEAITFPLDGKHSRSIAY